MHEGTWLLSLLQEVAKSRGQLVVLDDTLSDEEVSEVAKRLHGRVLIGDYNFEGGECYESKQKTLAQLPGLLLIKV